MRTTSLVIGALARTWSLFDRFSADGILDGYTSDWLDSHIGLDGWSLNLQHVGWLIVEEQSLCMPHFARWLGRSAKTRLKDAQRKKSERQNVSEKCPKNVRIDPDKNRTTVQYRREEKRRKNLLPTEACPTTQNPVAGPAGSESTEPDPTFLEFPVIGDPKAWTWPLLESKVAEWETAFPGVDVRFELRSAMQWCLDNPTGQKTARGMTHYLGGWLRRQVDRGKARLIPGDQQPVDVIDEYLQSDARPSQETVEESSPED
jgi:hypothetical protein